ncbi:hypothetical protein A7Q09_03360 [Methylacidiphilum sp. Yel]|uniref:efflux RND transporter periplasmic adaptor subunit n=1 Tax=Methylacidiphilum sp. Yel TaxID=1847730 RepID=UPI00106C1CA7|nr:efflux RND transporter periplasmic adaptor subunit [Methylacidiphilum sp. Yel]TFE70879.1 hypothetical protein A7Q09_03360 [Methylacidiphilum sp. Yel]
MESENNILLSFFSLPPDAFFERLLSFSGSFSKPEDLFVIVSQYSILNIGIKGMRIGRLIGGRWEIVWSSSLEPNQWETDYEMRVFFIQWFNKTFLEKHPCYLPKAPSGIDFNHPQHETLQGYNTTGLHHLFFHLMLGDTPWGVVHYWLEETKVLEQSYRWLSLLSSTLCDCLKTLAFAGKLLFQNSQASFPNASDGLYLKCLEELAVENDIERIEFLVVNYGREIAGCDRTCLFAVPLTSKGFSFLTTQDFEKANVFELKAVSSLSKIHKQSDQALLLKEAGIALFKAANPHHFQDKPPKQQRSVFAMFFDEAQAIEEQKITSVERKDYGPLRIGFAMRESAAKERPLAIIRYFQNIPMNWLAAFLLMDQQQRIYGFICWEGKEKIIPSLDLFSLLQKIAIIGGKCVARAYFKQKKFWIFSKTTRNHPLLNPLVFYPSLLALILIVAFFPLPMKIKGNAVLIPSYEISVPAMVSAKIESIHVQIGDYVKKGTLLIQMDPTNILLKIKEVEQDYKKNIAEADLAQNLKQETAMQLSRLNALKSQAILKSLYNDFYNCSIRAPIDGVVMGPSNLVSRRGDIPQVGEILVQLADPRYWKVKIALREQDFIYLGRVLESKKEPLGVSFRLAADPAKSYRLFLRSISQFISGVEIEGKKYEFSLIIPWEEKNIDQLLLKKGLRGQAKVYVGLRPLAHIALRDLIGFLRIHVFFW